MLIRVPHTFPSNVLQLVSPNISNHTSASAIQRNIGHPMGPKEELNMWGHSYSMSTRVIMNLSSSKLDALMIATPGIETAACWLSCARRCRSWTCLPSVARSSAPRPGWPQPWSYCPRVHHTPFPPRPGEKESINKWGKYFCITEPGLETCFDWTVGTRH